MTKQQRGTNGTETNHLPDVGNMVAQPELPCLTNEQIQDAVLAGGGLEYQYQCIALTQRDQDQLRMNKRIAQLQAMVLEQAKTLTIRNQCIAELERENTYLLGTSVDNGDYMKLQERAEKAEAEIASLKEQLAVFRRGIPWGKHCQVGSEDQYCKFLLGETCAVTGEAVRWDSDVHDYLKAPGCPVPAEEGEKP